MLATCARAADSQYPRIILNLAHQTFLWVVSVVRATQGTRFHTTIRFTISVGDLLGLIRHLRLSGSNSSARLLMVVLKSL